MAAAAYHHSLSPYASTPYQPIGSPYATATNISSTPSVYARTPATPGMVSSPYAIHPAGTVLDNRMTTSAINMSGGQTFMASDMVAGGGISTVTSQGDPTERRRVKSVILNEELLGPAPEESVRYVEVPLVEERVRHVPKKEYVEIEKRVPKIEYEWVERIVDVPQIHYVDKPVEVPQVHEVLKHVSRREVVEVPREVVRHVPKLETKVVEKIVEIPGEIIEVPKPYTVENKIPVPNYVDKEVPMVVAQTVTPVLAQSNEFVDVDVLEYEPEVIPVDIHVPKAVQSQLVSVGVVEEQHRTVRVPAAQYNSMLRMLNPHIAENDSTALPYLSTNNGAISFLGTGELVTSTQAMPGVQIEGWSGAAAHMHSARTLDSKQQLEMQMQQQIAGYDVNYRSLSGQVSCHVSRQVSQPGTDKSRMSQAAHSKKQRGMSGTTLTSVATSVRNTGRPTTRQNKKSKGTCPC